MLLTDTDPELQAALERRGVIRPVHRLLHDRFSMMQPGPRGLALLGR